MSVTQPLRSEHAELRPHLDQLDTLAASLGRRDADTPARLAASIEFLQAHLLPHAHAEEAALYPVVEQALGAPGATATMVADHRDIARRIEALAATARDVDAGPPSAEQTESLRAQLYGLSAILQLHFAKEEEVLLPILDTHLSDDQARDLFAAMADVAHPDSAGAR